jgi:hypothetical protein
VKGHSRFAVAFLLSCAGWICGVGCTSRTPQATEVQAAAQATQEGPAPVSAQPLSPLPQDLHGLAGAYTDASYLTAFDFGQHSHWRQPWRSFLETVPAQQFLDGVGIGFPVGSDLAPDLVARMLSNNGVRNVRIEIGWGAVNVDNEALLNNAEELTRVLAACKKWQLRPLILLNLNQGVPGPLKMFDHTVTQDAPKGSRQLHLDSADGLVVGRSGLSDLSDYWAAEALITKIDGDTVTLSKPLPVALKAGAKVKMATLKYRPFSVPGSADYKATLEGWKRYVGTVAGFVTRTLGTAGQADLGFDVEVYNELTFGAHFLSINDYYDPPLATYEEDSVWDNLMAATAEYAEQRPAQFAGVGLSNGFANTIPWTASSRQPRRAGFLSKHPYAGVKKFPADEQGGVRLGQDGKPTQAVPSYTALFPEYYGSGLQTETLLRDSAPLKTDIYGTVHGRFGRGPAAPVGVWITEVNIQPTEAGVTDPAAALALKARSAARYFAFYLNKGVSKVQLYAAFDGENGDAGYSILQDNFVRYASSNTTYPADDSAYTSPALSVVRRMTDVFKVDLDPGLKQPRPLQVRSVQDRHDHVQFAAAGNQPPLYNREVLAVLPYQVNAKRFVIAYYVMTRDVRQPLPAEEYTLELGGLNAAGARFSVYDPLTGQTVPLKVHAAQQDRLLLSLPATDTPRLLTVQEQ